MTAPLELRYPSEGSAISVILKLPGETCNIDCHYCYEKRKPYPDSAQLAPETVARFLDLCGGRPLRVELHGGEPLLMKPPLMAELFAVLRRYPGRIHLAMQTNGLLLDDERLRFLREEWPDLDLGVSLDGDPIVNDVHRVDYRGRGTSARVEQALRRLGDAGLSVGVIATVTQPSLGRAGDIVRYFAGFEAISYLKFSPCLDFNVTSKLVLKGNLARLVELNGSGTDRPGWATTPMEYADFMIDAFEAWREGAYRHFLIEPLASLIKVVSGSVPSFCHFTEAKCAFVVTLYPDGRIGSCDELRMPDAELARIDDVRDLDELLHFRTNPTLDRSLARLFEKCNECSYRTTCRGGCLATRLQFEGTPYDDEYCAHRARLVDFVSAQLASANTSAAL